MPSCDQVTETLAVALLVASVAVTVTDVVAETAWVEIVKVAPVAPAGIVTDVGTEAAVGSALESLTTQPPAGAAAGKLIVPVAELPPLTEVGEIVMLPIESSMTLSVAVLAVSASEAETMTE